MLARLDAPWAPVQSVTELLDDPQVEANGYIGDVVIDGEIAYRLPAVPVQFDGSHQHCAEHPNTARTRRPCCSNLVTDGTTSPRSKRRGSSFERGGPSGTGPR